jgi:hypothetical protein
MKYACTHALKIKEMNITNFKMCEYNYIYGLVISTNIRHNTCKLLKIYVNKCMYFNILSFTFLNDTVHIFFFNCIFLEILFFRTFPIYYKNQTSNV